MHAHKMAPALFFAADTPERCVMCVRALGHLPLSPPFAVSPALDIWIVNSWGKRSAVHPDSITTTTIQQAANRLAVEHKILVAFSVLTSPRFRHTLFEGQIFHVQYFCVV